MIRLYGPIVGNGSFARVCNSTRDALSRMGLLDGLVPIDCYDEEEVYPGFDADIGLFIGPPSQSLVMSQIGAHKERILLLAPNSSWLPDGIVKIEKYLTGFVSPSSWGVDVIKTKASLPVELLRHGVSDLFSVRHEQRKVAIEAYKARRWNLVHLASTIMQRKGTHELVEAWFDHIRELDGWRCKLTLVINGSEDYFKSAIREAARGDHRLETTVVTHPALNLNESRLSAFYSQFHGVVQPSRGEGFGLIPLEARACGVPVVMTSCTGHDEHAYERNPGSRFVASGVQLVVTGEDTSIDDGPGAMAPSLPIDSLKRALDTFHEDWLFLSSDAESAAAGVTSEWSWDRGIERWLKERNGR